MQSNQLLNNRYQLEERLGTGGMAEVFRAKDLMLERTVAIKILRENYFRDPAFRERFRQEAKAAANLSHTSIVTIHDFGFNSDKLFIVMEYVPGTDLKMIIQRRGSINVDEALPLMIQACAGIGYAHRAGLVHCDVKSQNLIITPDQRLKITDFGIARALASINPEEKTDIVWGSPQYFSPEQAMGGPPSPASDVYSLGVVLYEMLTGRLPFLGTTTLELARQHRSEPPPPPRRYNASIPPALEQIIFKVLSKEPSARYRTADQLGRVLMTFNRPTIASEIIPQTLPPVNKSHSTSTRATPQTGPTAKTTTPLIPQAGPSQPNLVNRENPLNIDWITWGLVIMAIIALGGLFPLWLWVYLEYFP